MASSISAAAASEPEHSTKEREEEEENATATRAADDEDTGAQVAPIVKLEEVAVTTGEEDEDAILDLKSKLYRFDKEGNQWKERGVGTVKLLKHKESAKVRLVFRQSKTLKICANHLVLPTINLQEHHGNDKSCLWHAADFADGELKDELFCIRFPSVENCKTFKETVEEVAENQGKKAESKDAADAAGLIEKLSVEDSKKEKEEAPVAAEEVSETTDDKAKAEEEEKDEPASST
uniref:RanBD1 domain-containing protein n=1 Tax=Salix viminalis TaxID=40686 RepID=A0A6N2KVZ6_SALVM